MGAHMGALGANGGPMGGPRCGTTACPVINNNPLSLRTASNIESINSAPSVIPFRPTVVCTGLPKVTQFCTLCIIPLLPVVA